MNLNFTKKMACSLVFSLSIWTFGQNFITQWKTDNPGTSASNQITVPASGEFIYSWEEIGNQSNTGNGTGNGVTIIEFPQAGTYQLSISPNGTEPFHRIEFNNGGDVDKILSVEAWGSIVWSSMANAFSGASNLVINASDSPNLSNVTSLSGMFAEAENFNQNIEQWNLSNVTDISGMFYKASSFNQSLNNWNVSNVTNMSGTFNTATSFNQPLNNWNVENVTAMTAMFMGALSFNQNIESWNTGNVTTMEGMFADTQAFNQPLGNWNMSAVTVTSGMFYGNPNFNQAIENWDVSNVMYMAGMFDGAISFNQPLNNWDTSSLQVAATMFAHTNNFNQPLDNWNVGQLWLGAQMFDSAAAFDQDLGNWDLNSLQVGDLMFANSGMSCENYSHTLAGWSSNPSLAQNVTLGAQSLEFSPEVVSARTTMTNDFGWSFVGDTQGTCSLGLVENNSMNISLFPNPANEFVNVNGLNGTETIYLYDAKGKLLQTLHSNKTGIQINTQPLIPGVYFVSIVNGDGNRTTKKLLVN